jgi:hypothetical protein
MAVSPRNAKLTARPSDSRQRQGWHLLQENSEAPTRLPLASIVETDGEGDCSNSTITTSFFAGSRSIFVVAGSLGRLGMVMRDQSLQSDIAVILQLISDCLSCLDFR